MEIPSKSPPLLLVEAPGKEPPLSHTLKPTRDNQTKEYVYSI